MPNVAGAAERSSTNEGAQRESRVNKHALRFFFFKFKLTQAHVAQFSVLLRVEVGARALRNPVRRGGGCGKCFCIPWLMEYAKRARCGELEVIQFPDGAEASAVG
jgi:hypothetical protein